MSLSVLAMVLLLGLIVGGAHLLDHQLRNGGRQRVQGARWASKRDLRHLRVSGPEPGRLILGRHGRHLIAAEERASVLVVGPSTTSLKTSGFAIPSLLEWQGPAIATSVKSDLLGATLAHRGSLGGEAMVFDPTATTKRESVTATPLSSCKGWQGAMRMAHWLARAAQSSGSSGLQDAEFWHTAAEKLLAPLFYAAASGGRTMEDVIGWLEAGKEAEDEVTRLLVNTDASESALSAWKANLRREERHRSSIYTTAETILAAFADPGVLAASKGEDPYTPAALLDGRPSTLYLCAPAHEQERLRTLFAAMIAEVLAAVYERSAESGKPIDPPLLIVLDEAANIAPLPDLDVLASTGAGQGIQLVTVFQDFAQVQARYGRRAQTILNNHRAKVFASGIADPETLRYVNAVIGAGEFRQRSETAGEGGRSSATEASTYRDLAPANVVRGAKPGSALLVYGHLGAGRIEMRPWFNDSALRELIAWKDDDDS